LTGENKDTYDIVKEQNLLLEIYSANLATITKEKILDEVKVRKGRKKCMNQMTARAILLFAALCVKIGYPGEMLSISCIKAFRNTHYPLERRKSRRP
jgi:hypothetical protein